jgi:hypothetical protein
MRFTVKEDNFETKCNSQACFTRFIDYLHTLIAFIWLFAHSFCELSRNIQTPTATISSTPTLTPVPLSTVLYFEDFENGVPDGWGSIVGTWSVERENGNNYWKGTGTKNYPQAWLKKEAARDWTDFAFESRIRFIKGGLFMCARSLDGGKSFYNAFLSSKDNWMSFAEYDGTVKNDGSNYQTFSDKALQLQTNRWYILRFELQGEDLRLYLDDELINSGSRKKWSQGGVGFYMGGGDEIHFDDIRIWSLLPMANPTLPVSTPAT